MHYYCSLIRVERLNATRTGKRLPDLMVGLGLVYNNIYRLIFSSTSINPATNLLYLESHSVEVMIDIGIS